MNPSPTKEPPAPLPALNDSATHMVSVRLNCPFPAVVADYFPSGNRIGTRLLGRWIAERLRAHGLLTGEDVGVAGPLDRGMLLFIVPAIVPAVEQIKSVIREFGFLENSQIGFYDPREGITRSLYPRTGDVVATPLEEMQRELEMLNATSANLRAAMQQARSKPEGQ